MPPAILRLQKQKTREVKGKEYFRYSVVISPEDVKELGWEEGEELTPNRKGESLIISKHSRGKKSE
jgi:formylmethanofuran dehydrogenase subunit D